MGYYYSYPYDIFEELGVAFEVIAVFYLLALGFSVLSYVLQAVGMYTIAKRREIKNPWLAWIPYGNIWILGSISDQYQFVAQNRVKNRRKTLLGLFIAVIVLTMIVVGFAAYLIYLDAVGGYYYTPEETLIALAIVAGVAYLAMLVISIIYTVQTYMCLYNLYASCNPDSKVAFLLLSIFFTALQPIFVFVCRKKDLGMPPKRSEATFQQPSYQPLPNYQAQTGYQPNYQAQTGYQPNYQAQTGYQPNYQGQTGYQPNYQAQTGYQPNYQAQTGYQPNYQGQTGYQPNYQAQPGYQPNYQAQTGYQPNYQPQTGYQPNYQPQTGYQPNYQAQTGYQPNYQAQAGYQPNYQGQPTSQPEEDVEITIIEE